MTRARDLKFGTQMYSGNTSKKRKEKSRKGAWPTSREPKNFSVHPNVSPKRVEIVLKFGTQVHSGNISKNTKKSLEKGRGLGHVTPQNFGVHPNVPNVSPKRVELQSWNLVHRCIVAIFQKNAKKNLEKGRGQGHVTPKILAYTLMYLQNE